MNFTLLLGAGALSALGFTALTRRLTRSQELALYVFVLIGAAVIYMLLGFSRTGWGGLAVEGGGVLLFSLLALLSRRGSLFLLSLAWALHAAWDLWVHATLAGNFMPYWFRWGCAGFDLVIAGYVAGRFAKS